MNPLKSAPLSRAQRLEARRRVTALRALVDEYGDLSKQIQPIKPAIARIADVAKSLRVMHDSNDPTKAIEIDGDQYHLVLSPCGNETSISDMQAVYDALGHERFLEACTVSLKALQSALEKRAVETPAPSTCISSLTQKEQSGSRSITVTELAEE